MINSARTACVLGYVRVSARTNGNSGPGAQEADLRDHYRRLGVDLIEVYRDIGIAGGTDDRPGLRALFARTLRPGNGITEIGVCSLSRVSRNLDLLDRYCQKLMLAGIRLVAITEDVEGGPEAAIIRTTKTTS